MIPMPNAGVSILERPLVNQGTSHVSYRSILLQPRNQLRPKGDLRLRTCPGCNPDYTRRHVGCIGERGPSRCTRACGFSGDRGDRSALRCPDIPARRARSFQMRRLRRWPVGSGYSARPRARLCAGALGAVAPCRGIEPPSQSTMLCLCKQSCPT